MEREEEIEYQIWFLVPHSPPKYCWRAPAPPIILSRLVPNNHSGESIKQEKTMEEQLWTVTVEILESNLNLKAQVDI